jgi:hypothetical protein
MGGQDVANLVHIPGQGNLSIATNAAPLLVVFGGVDVHKVHSGVYMWNYMNPVRHRFHIFVAQSNSVNGTLAYGALLKTATDKGLKPSQQILYLFSGGYKPGIDVLTTSGARMFSSIYLVDIWMSGAHLGTFYQTLADHNASKMTYVYTTFGANNKVARDYIAKKVGVRATLVQGLKHEGGMDTHLRTNVIAVSSL